MPSAHERVDHGTGGELVLDREARSAVGGHGSPAAMIGDRRALAALLLHREDAIGDRRAVAQRGGEHHDPAGGE